MQNAHTPTLKPMLVAVDGSSESENALRWAYAQAQQMGCELRVITCYKHKHVTGESAGISWERFESTKEASEQAAAQVIHAVLGDNPVEHILALGPVDTMLINYSQDASMLVLGTRASFGAHGMVRSSTTDRVTGKVSCPVVSIPLMADQYEGALL